MTLIEDWLQHHPATCAFDTIDDPDMTFGLWLGVFDGILGGNPSTVEQAEKLWMEGYTPQEAAKCSKK